MYLAKIPIYWLQVELYLQNTTIVALNMPVHTTVFRAKTTVVALNIGYLQQIWPYLPKTKLYVVYILSLFL